MKKLRNTIAVEELKALFQMLSEFSRGLGKIYCQFFTHRLVILRWKILVHTGLEFPKIFDAIIRFSTLNQLNYHKCHEFYNNAQYSHIMQSLNSSSLKFLKRQKEISKKSFVINIALEAQFLKLFWQIILMGLTWHS